MRIRNKPFPINLEFGDLFTDFLIRVEDAIEYVRIQGYRLQHMMYELDIIEKIGQMELRTRRMYSIGP